jgi:hypothetical protein
MTVTVQDSGRTDREPGNIPLGLACGYGGVLLGFVAGGLWANHYDTKRERRP